MFFNAMHYFHATKKLSLLFAADVSDCLLVCLNMFRFYNYKWKTEYYFQGTCIISFLVHFKNSSSLILNLHSM
jgi:ribosome-associated toxin RatA of RatAB toxin-antitoxin module